MSWFNWMLRRRAEEQKYNEALAKKQLDRARADAGWPQASNTAGLNERERAELEELRRWRAEQMQAKLSHMGAGVAFAAPHPPRGLSSYRISDLAGYVGRVHELLTFAGLLIDAPIEAGPHAAAMAEHFKASAAKAHSIQMDLVNMGNELAEREQRDADSDAIRAAMAGPSQWTSEEIERYRRGNAAPVEPNRIKEEPLPQATAWYAGKDDPA